MKHTYIRLFILAITIFCTLPILAQNKGVFISPRISIQSDFQKADFKDNQFPFEFKEHKATTVNWGIDLLIEKNLTNKFSVYIGIGYFRNKFNFKRSYDHRLLNIGADSLPIGTRTYNYIYHLLRLPIGIMYNLKQIGNYKFDVGVENIVDFSFEQVYNGAKPFPNANNKYSAFRYYGNSVLIFAQISKQFSQSSSLQFGPYVRVSNIYRRKDKFIYEDETKPYSRIFDAIGVSLKYSFNYKK